jgi:type IV pilus assembly protein PilC
MPQMFAYKARNLSGRIMTGKVEADNQGAAVARLREKNFFVVDIKPRRDSEINLDKLFCFKLKTKDMALFCRQLSTMIEAGIPLLQCLYILIQQTENKNLQKILREVVVEIEKGKTLTDAFKVYKEKLPDLFINMLAAGEASGTLDQALGRLAVQFEKDHEMMEKVKSTMTYPVVVAIFAAVAVVALIILVVPIFADIFSSMGAQLPLPTRILIAVSNVFKKYWYAMPLVAVVLFSAFRRTIATRNGKKAVDRFILRMPIVGKLTGKTITARFARTLATLLRSGVPLMQSLETLEDVVGNTLVAGEIAEARALVREGERMAPVFMKGKFFPPMVVNMISIGEESGSLDNLLEKLAMFYEQEVETMVARLSSIIEPLMIAGVGIMVGFIALSIYMPLFSMSGVLQGGTGGP